MTAHELFVSLFWLVVLAYGLYVAWFTLGTLRSARRRRIHRQPADSAPSPRHDDRSR